MSALNNSPLLGASGSQGYFLQRSVRLRASASANFARTPASTGNRKTWTWSAWVKRGALGGTQQLFGSATSAPNQFVFTLTSGNALEIVDYRGGVTITDKITTPLYRDSSSWYHIILVVDTTQAVAENRFKLYVNGIQVTAFSTNTVNTLQNADLDLNQSGTPLRIGDSVFGGGAFDGYLTEINFVDGQALTPTSFGEFNSLTGVWQPKKYAGTYGTNGFYLNFQDNSGATATTIGKDSSGNGNNWTPNNISVTAGVTYDSMLDVPTNTSATNANFAVLNPLDKASSASVLNGNLRVTSASAAAMGSRGTIQIPTSGKWYYEATVVNSPSGSAVIEFGSATDIASLTALQASGSYGIYVSASISYMNNGTATGNLGSLTAGDIIQFAGDCDNSRIWIGKNNVYWDASSGTTGNPSANTNPTLSVSPALMFPLYLVYNNSLDANFGQRPFTYTPPTGFKSLNTYNLPAPTIPNGATQFAATTFTGNGSTQSITNTVNGTSFQPDFLWVKNRSVTSNNRLVDAVRGVSSVLSSNTTDAQSTDSLGVTALNTGGFTVGSSSGFNNSPNAYVGWQWKASNAAAVTNTSGSITSQVSANQTAGFSVVTINSPGSSTFTFGHGLGVAPRMMIVKSRTTVTSWLVYHASATTTTSQYLVLNSTAATATVTNIWGTALPTSSVAGGLGNQWGLGTDNYVAYCFAAVPGYSAFGSYTGNGSTDGPFVYLGFKPRWLMIKRSDSNNVGTAYWFIYDTSRNTANVTTNWLAADLSSAETSTSTLDLVANGFKWRDSGGSVNASGGTYIYAAFAESPFNYSLAR